MEQKRELIQRQCQAKPASFDVTFLECPVTKEDATPQTRRNCTKRLNLNRREVAVRKAHRLSCPTQPLRVDSDLIECTTHGAHYQSRGIGQIEVKPLWAKRFGNVGFAMRPLSKTPSLRLDIDIRGQRGTDKRAGRKKHDAVTLKSEASASGALVSGQKVLIGTQKCRANMTFIVEAPEIHTP